MSSLRNAVKRITHKERSQPQNRAHLGLLEKKTDYKGRAMDYQRKQKRIRNMQEKASQRNPDEFYFEMKNSQVIDGRHRKTEEAKQREFAAEVGTDTIRLMKSQDLGYIRMQKQKDIKKIERLQSLVKEKTNNTHTVFVQSPKEAQEFDAAEHFDTCPELMGRSFNRPRKEVLENEALKDNGLTESDVAFLSEAREREARKLLRSRARKNLEVDQRTRRLRTLERAEAHIVTDKLVQGKGRKRKIKAAQNGQPAQYQWRRKRLR